jgi:dihydroorotase
MKLLLENCNIMNHITNLLINGEKISYIGENPQSYDKKININGNIVIPGMIDVHTHIRDLQLSHKETWETASKSAVKGGVTTVIDMPNTVPATTNKYNLLLKKEKAKNSIVNYGFHIGVEKDNIDNLGAILSDKTLQIAGIKVFLTSSNSDEFLSKNEELMEVFDIARKYDKPVVVHSELHSYIEKWKSKYIDKQYDSVLFHNLVRNRECVIKGLELIMDIASVIGNTIYLAHTSTSEEIELIKTYKSSYDFPFYCEVTPHHLLLNIAAIENVGNIAKVNPPIRTKDDNNALWNGILNGVIDTIGSDHAPHLLEEKQKSYDLSPSGIPALETTMPLLLNEVNKGNLTIEKLVELTSINPAKIFKIKDRGLIKEGYYADLVVIDLKKDWTIDASNFETKAHYSPFDGLSINGKVITTIVNGNIVYDNEKIIENNFGKEIEYE